MNTKILVMTLTLLFFVTGCEKNNTDDIDVETYVKLLKSGDYDLTDEFGMDLLPSFTQEDIPELLEYADEQQIITKYPQNPISSINYPDPRLGILILWTIESVRITATDMETGKFPSLGPTFMIKNSAEPIDIETAHKAASEAYKNWWNLNTDFEKIRDIDPLENSIYGWR